MVAASSAGNVASSPPASSTSGNSPTDAPTVDTEPPVITIDGENPAHIHVGDNYADLGARITAPEQDKNLGIKTYLNGALVSNIVLDTSAVATDTIDYVATDQSGLTSTSTRQVIIDPLTPPPSLPVATSSPVTTVASSTAATSTI